MATFNGTDSSELISGTANDDTINGFGGNDTLIGLGGNDILNGGTGNDVLTGGPGTDTLTGGPGADTFTDTAAGLNGDTITDFSLGDHIQITDSTITQNDITVNGDVISFPGGSVTVTGLSNWNARFFVTNLQGGGVDIHLENAANNDFNGDGKSDILWRNTDGTLTDWLSTSTGGFTNNWNASVSSVATSWHVAGTGDFNGDGHADVLWRNDDGTLADWLGNANGGFTHNYANSVASVPTSWQVAGTGDFNGDGHSDILWRNSDGTLTDWLGTANGGFTNNAANEWAGIPTSWTVAATGDFNGDGLTDILWRNTDGSLTDWLGTANGSFTDNSANAWTGVPTGWTVAGTGDFNGDGLTDILWLNTNGTYTDWLGTANGGFTANWNNTNGVVPTSWTVAAIGDFNGNGIDDVLWRNSDGSLTDWLGTANGSFTDNSANAWNYAPTSWHVEGHNLV